MTVLVEISTALDGDDGGVDVYFLNRAPVKRVTSAAQIQDAFAIPPQGFTPMVNALDFICSEQIQHISSRPVLLIMATDGEPTLLDGRPDIGGFAQWMQRKPPNLFVSIIACSDQRNDLGYLADIEKQASRTVVTHEFALERNDIALANNDAVAFSFREYLVKILLGSLDESIVQPENHSKGCVLQ
ncbi:hypothetical protein HDU91_005521 [Kappamyces sp. JEL0680]|nr:hypothetical protein HDU91_005521 [Kappamyces sp. JEL0680]